MKPARLAVLAIAVIAGGSAMLMTMGETPPPPAPVEVATPAAASTEILVASADLPIGQVLKAEDLRWQAWPEQGLSAGYITRSVTPRAAEEAVGAIVRTSFLANEPIRQEKLVRAGSGFMSAILPAGMRAVAITTDRGGANSVGGFVLPNDYVDVIRVYRDEAAGSSEQMSETLLSNVRVLAVGQVVQERNGASVQIGETATLALTPQQAEVVTLAQKSGQLSLTLRSIQDSGAAYETVAEAGADTPVTVVRFGVAKQQSRR